MNFKKPLNFKFGGLSFSAYRFIYEQNKFREFCLSAYNSYRLYYQVQSHYLGNVNVSELESEYIRQYKEYIKGLQELVPYKLGESDIKSLFPAIEEQDDAVSLGILPLGAVEWLSLPDGATEELIEQTIASSKHPFATSDTKSKKDIKDIYESNQKKFREWFKMYDNYKKFLNEEGSYNFDEERAEFIPICFTCGHLRFMKYSKCPCCGQAYDKSEEPKSEIAYCSQCGAKVEKGAKFCAKCGASI